MFCHFSLICSLTQTTATWKPTFRMILYIIFVNMRLFRASLTLKRYSLNRFSVRSNILNNFSLEAVNQMSKFSKCEYVKQTLQNKRALIEEPHLWITSEQTNPIPPVIYIFTLVLVIAWRVCVQRLDRDRPKDWDRVMLDHQLEEEKGFWPASKYVFVLPCDTNVCAGSHC